ncbi:right-handed parallel beta-helix repeat-containing protein [Archangium minus]|uniref:Right-handed parallel beta-helix repeat-containing protein n=1 Tax=Archangium minus TaxID=83450 RepID=A0ABY9WGR3_9BACT|nr:right-handed parallel beta-helix repeat-containing protein [Archangium minus]
MSRADAKHLALLVMSLALGVVGCSEEGPLPVTYAPLGAARFFIVVPPSFSTVGVERVEVTTSLPEGGTRSVLLSDAEGQWNGRINGLRAVSGHEVTAEGWGALGFQRFVAGATNVTIPRSNTALVLLTAREPSPSPPTGNVSPLIDSLVASADEVEPRGMLSLRAEVRDPNTGDVLTVSWAATSGSFADTHSASTVWTAPNAEGPQTLSLTVTDPSGVGVVLELTLSVKERRTRNPAVRAVLRELSPTAPSIREVFASPASVGPGELLHLRVTATVAHGVPSFSWSTTAGFMSPPEGAADSSETLWVSPSCLPADVPHTVTVTVSNSAGLSTSHTFPVVWTGPVCTRPLCAFSLEKGRLAAAADCTTDSTLFIPDTFAFDGQGHTVTAVDPSGGTFTGAVIRNRGSTAYVRGVTVTTSGLKDACEAGAKRLRGILLEGASGEVVDSWVSGLSRGSGTSGCQEGFGIEIRNDDMSRGPFRVEVLRNHVSKYEKIGILATGAVDVTIDGNSVEGGGAVSDIARNGIQISDGAKARVLGNKVSGNAYTGSDTVGTGVLVKSSTGKPLVLGPVIESNILIDNDIGIYLEQDAGDPPDKAARAWVSNNVLQSDVVSNPIYQAAISDYYGTGSVITSNLITGVGYNPKTAPDVTFSVDVYTPLPVSQLSFLTSSYDITTDVCSKKVTVQSQDSVGNLKPSTGSFALTATGSAAPGVTFHADPACTDAAISSVDLSNPQAEATFYFKSSQRGTVTVQVAGGGLSPVSQDQIIR